MIKTINIMRRDFKIFTRNRFHFVILFLTIIFILSVNFFIPSSLRISKDIIILDNTQSVAIKSYFEGSKEIQIYSDENKFYTTLKNSTNVVGILVEQDDNSMFQLTMLHQGNESQVTLRILDAYVNMLSDRINNIKNDTNIKIEILNHNTKSIPLNKLIVPLILFFEVIMFSFIIIGVMAFQEKQEGYINAYRVSAGGVSRYILSKIFENVIFSLILSATILSFTLGLPEKLLSLIILIITMSSVIALLSIFLSNLFNNYSSFLFMSIFILLFLGTPVITYVYPSFSSVYIKMIPSYIVLFGFREILFPTGRQFLLLPFVFITLVEIFILYVVNYRMLRFGSLRRRG